MKNYFYLEKKGIYCNDKLSASANLSYLIDTSSEFMVLDPFLVLVSNSI